MSRAFIPRRFTAASLSPGCGERQKLEDHRPEVFSCHAGAYQPWELRRVVEVTAATSDRFASRAADFGVELTRTTADEAAASIDAVVEDPAVGVPLPWEDVSLPAGIATDPTPTDLDAAATGVTAAALAIADYGSVVLQATPGGVEPVSLFPDRHVAVLRERDIVPDMEAAFAWLGGELRATRGSAIIATGPSATADMGELVKGAHGPKEVHVIVVT